MKIKNTSLHLLRIIAMFFIVFYCTILKGNIINNCSNEFLKILYTFLLLIFSINFNILVIIEGYINIKKASTSSKIWKMININLFYKISFIVIYSLLKIQSFTPNTIIKSLLPFNIDEYWFIKYFILLLFITPYLNKHLQKIKKDKFQKLLLTLFIIFSVLPYLTGSKAFENNGFTLYNFIFMYMIGAYLKLHNIRYSYIFKKCSKELYKLIIIIILLSSIFTNFAVYIMAFNLKEIGPIFKEIFQNIENMSFSLSNPFIIIEGVTLFLIFKEYKIKSKIINYMSTLMIGIYLIIDNPILSNYIYKWLQIDSKKINSITFFPQLIITIIALFSICTIIECIRNLVFTFIYNRNFSKNLVSNYNKKLKNINFNKKTVR